MVGITTLCEEEQPYSPKMVIGPLVWLFSRPEQMKRNGGRTERWRSVGYSIATCHSFAKGQIQAVFLLSLSQTALGARDYQAAMKALDSLETCTAPLSQDAPTNRILEELRIYYLLTRIIADVQSGRNKHALDLLTDLHPRLESHNKSTVAPDSICSVPVRDKDGGQTILVPVRLLTRHRLYIMGFFASGIVHKAEDPTKAKKYLLDGLKAIASRLSLNA